MPAAGRLPKGRERPTAQEGLAPANKKQKDRDTKSGGDSQDKKNEESEKNKEGGRSKNNKEDEEGTSIGKAIEYLAKLSLNSAQQVRVLNGCCLTTFLCPSSQEYIRAAEEEGKTYAEMVRQQGRDHKWGAPHPHIIMAVLEVWKDDQGIAPQDKKVVEELYGYGKEEVQKIGMVISYFRAKATYQKKDTDDKVHKVTWGIDMKAKPFGNKELSFSPAELQQTLVQIIELKGGHQKLGMAPKGENERAVERLLRRK